MHSKGRRRLFGIERLTEAFRDPSGNYGSLTMFSFLVISTIAIVDAVSEKNPYSLINEKYKLSRSSSTLIKTLMQRDVKVSSTNSIQTQAIIERLFLVTKLNPFLTYQAASFKSILRCSYYDGKSDCDASQSTRKQSPLKIS